MPLKRGQCNKDRATRASPEYLHCSPNEVFYGRAYASGPRPPATMDDTFSIRWVPPLPQRCLDRALPRCWESTSCRTATYQEALPVQERLKKFLAASGVERSIVPSIGKRDAPSLVLDPRRCLRPEQAAFPERSPALSHNHADRKTRVSDWRLR